MDATALKDVRTIGAEYIRSFGTVLHTTEGLKPGYLPQAEATAVLSGAIHLLTLSSYLEERATKLKREALGRVMVALAGSPPNCLYQLLESFFGYKEVSASAGASVTSVTGDSRATLQTVEEQTTSFAVSPPPPPKDPSPGFQVPSHLRAAAATTTRVFSSGSETESRASGKPSPEATRAVGIKPGPNSDLWTDTGLAAEYVPHLDAGGADYACAFPNCHRKPVAQKDTMATHIRRDHLNIAIACHYCPKLFWSHERWGKHCRGRHNTLPPVPAKVEESPSDVTPQEVLTTLEEIKHEEDRILKEVDPNPSLSTAEPEVIEVTESDKAMLIGDDNEPDEDDDIIPCTQK